MMRPIGIAAIVVLVIGVLLPGTGIFAGSDPFAGWQETLLRAESLVSKHPITSLLVIFLMHVVLAATGLPGAAILMLLTGSTYGIWLGTVVALTACTLGSTLTLLAVRNGMRPWVQKRWGQRLALIDVRLHDDGVRYLLSLRLFPAVPFVLVNIAAGISSLRVWKFFWVSFVGMLPGTAVYVHAGTALAAVRTPADIVTPSTLLALFAVSLLPLLPGLAKRMNRGGEAV